MKIFYTYAWSREDGTPYYIGKSFRGRNGNRAYRKGCPPRERIAVQEWPDESTAFAYEVYQIDFWGRKDNNTGILRNRTDGGEGISGQIISEEARRKMSIAAKQKPKPSHLTCQKMSDAQCRRYAEHPEQRQKVSTMLIGNTYRRGSTASLETRHKMGAARKGNTNGIGNRSNLGRKLPLERRQEISRFMEINGKSFWTPERRALQAERMRRIRRKAVGASTLSDMEALF